MPAVMTVGQQGTLRFLPDQAGLDPAAVTRVRWSTQGDQTRVRLTAPNLVEGLAPGTAPFSADVDLGATEKVTYTFDITCHPAGPPAPPRMVPVTVDITPPAPPTP